MELKTVKVVRKFSFSLFFLFIIIGFAVFLRFKTKKLKESRSETKGST